MFELGMVVTQLAAAVNPSLGAFLKHPALKISSCITTISS